MWNLKTTVAKINKQKQRNGSSNKSESESIH